MVIFELPKETEQIQILGNIYEIDVMDFNIITEIENMPSMADGFRPTEIQFEFHIQQIQNIFSKILGEKLNFPKKTPDKTYWMARSLLKMLYDFYIDNQSKYLDHNYSIKKDELEKLRLMNSIYQNMPKGADKVEPDTSEN